MSDSTYFVGTVALINSLRLTGTDAAVSVLDLGLADGQRERLEPQASVLTPRSIHNAAILAKPYSATHSDADVVIIIDSDMILTSDLNDIVSDALGGKIVAFPDSPDHRRRSFHEWETAFRLRAPLRHEVYVNSGFVAFCPAVWPGLLARWAETCELVPPSSTEQRLNYVETRETWPYADPDQDALNALLMSEVEQSAVRVLPYWSAPFPHHLSHVVVEDERTLSCRVGERRVRLLHFVNSPKPWQPWGWTRGGMQQFLTLAPRLLMAPDVAIRLRREELPRWLGSAFGRYLVRTAVPVGRHAARGLLRALPRSSLHWVRRVTQRT